MVLTKLDTHRLRLVRRVLSRSQRSLLVAYYIERVKQEDLATRFGVCQKTISNRLRAINRRLAMENVPIPTIPHGTREQRLPGTQRHHEVMLGDDLLTRMVYDRETRRATFCTQCDASEWEG